MDYVIIQAGGKGTRLGYLTKNKPKALTPVKNLPMIFYLFRKYPDKRFVIIADYKKDVLHRYLSAFADVKYQIVDASGTGTCGGIRQAIDLIPDDKPFMLVWSDLILPDGFELPEEYNDTNDSSEKNAGHIDDGPESDYVGISSTFSCRWKFEDGKFEEERSTEHGVAGFFLFGKKAVIADVPESGELVRWMQGKNLKFKEVSLAGTREFGLLEEYEKLGQVKTRPFNRITVEGDVLIKEPVDEQGRKLAKRECAWYVKAKDKGIKGLPIVYETSPLKMEFIKGKNIYDCNYGYDDKKKILESLVDTLKTLHESEKSVADSFSMKEAYYNKTMERLSKVQNLVPYALDESITVNGRKCRNVFYHRDKLENALSKLRCNEFSFIHGDCTFSNLMIRDNGEPVLIDPRGYFGFTEIYGDERYDWAKLYYSIVGNYDRFNLKKFNLDIGGHSIVDGKAIETLGYGEVRLSIESNGWEDMEKDFFNLTGADEYEIKLLHAVIWLSLTTYTWQDYDSVCGSFYNGLYYLEEVL
ncbi:sugar phosphate nucleotidyltransferase [Butyrivibrio sp. WCD3002]|uniref:sugar phosphate nucleotidyltransferase n=1 Tax=Butyrivibrio sp. WCD3002 TaxID=1280676 RepID=UPI00055A99B4|nr:sugar phosphate nucleotidyltransferase [Butyrivibrio sp. WCD3002]